MAHLHGLAALFHEPRSLFWSMPCRLKDAVLREHAANRGKRGTKAIVVAMAREGRISYGGLCSFVCTIALVLFIVLQAEAF